MTHLPTSTLLLAILVSADAAAQREQEKLAEEVFREEIEVTEVLLDVVVTDKRDRIILGLGQGDFIVEEDGRAVDLSSVTFYSSKRLLESSSRLGGSAGAVDTVPGDRYFVLFVESQLGGGLPGRRRQSELGRELSRWLVERTQPADRVAVVSFRHGLTVHQDFTTDREALLQAVDDAVRGRDPAKIPASRRRTVPGDPPAFSSLPNAKELRKSSREIYRALTLVADAIGSVPGRKNLLFLGRGFGEVGSYGTYRPRLAKLKPMLEALNAANVAVYTVDTTPPEIDDSLQMSLRDLAAATGGRFFYHHRRFAASLQDISDLTSGYYLLSYQSHRPAGSAGFQVVRVGARSPEFRIQARRGYRYGTRQ